MAHAIPRPLPDEIVPPWHQRLDGESSRQQHMCRAELSPTRVAEPHPATTHNTLPLFLKLRPAHRWLLVPSLFQQGTSRPLSDTPIPWKKHGSSHRATLTLSHCKPLSFYLASGYQTQSVGLHQFPCCTQSDPVAKQGMEGRSELGRKVKQPSPPPWLPRPAA